VKVLAPPSLRQAYADRLKQAVAAL